MSSVHCGVDFSASDTEVLMFEKAEWVLEEQQPHLSFSLLQALHEEKTSHEKEMNNMKARFEEEGSQMKESQARALEEVAKKHRVTLETSLASAEKDKNRLLAVSVHTSERRGSLCFSLTRKYDIAGTTSLHVDLCILKTKIFRNSF